jgi:cytochrome P450
MPNVSRLFPPGPKSSPALDTLFGFSAEALADLQKIARDYGDIASFSQQGNPRILLSHPDWITQVLVVQHSRFHKSELTQQSLGDFLGEGMLTSEGDLWRRQRSLAQPAFRRSHIVEYAPVMIEFARERIRRWRDGEQLDLAQEMMALTLSIVVRALFGNTLDDITDYWSFDALVQKLIADREALRDSGPCQHNDVLALLMSAMDETGGRMTRKQLRDETITLLVAGHATTALALAWTWYLLSNHPAVEARLHKQLREVLGGRMPEATDTARLPYLQAIVNESLRLYPPAPLLSRRSIVPCTIGDYEFPANTTFIMSPWVLHRDRRFFDDPESFRPERWLNGERLNPPPKAYFPFGNGPRRCIGEGFALLEAQLIIAVIAQHFQLRLVPGHIVEPEVFVTLRPRFGMRMKVCTRM